MNRLIPGLAALALLGILTWLPGTALAGGYGQDNCPIGFSSVLIPDNSPVGYANARLQPGAHGRLGPTYLPSGQYVVAAEGTLGPANTPPNAPYVALCWNSHGKPGAPIVMSAQGNAGPTYELPLTYMRGQPITTAWLPEGNYQAVSGDSYNFQAVRWSTAAGYHPQRHGSSLAHFRRVHHHMRRA